jgi:hypothetical protein
MKRVGVVADLIDVCLEICAPSPASRLARREAGHVVLIALSEGLHLLLSQRSPFHRYSRRDAFPGAKGCFLAWEGGRGGNEMS